MATENELLQQMEELRNAVQGLGDVVKDDTGFFKSLGEELGGTSKTLKQTRADLGKHLGASLKDAGSNLTSFAIQVGRGDTTFTALNGVVDTATDAIAGLAKAIPYAGEVLAAGVKAAGEAAKFVLAEMQDVTNTFKDLGSVGALTATGMTGLTDQFLKSRMTMEGYKKVVMENAGALARFGGIAGEGAERFSKAVGDIIDNQGDELRKLGYGADQIGQVAAGFLKQQTLLGKQNQLTQDQLRSGSVAYARELDELSKLTGANKDQLQKAQDDALRESRFLASQLQLEDQNKKKEAQAIRDYTAIIGQAAPDAAKGLRDIATGTTTTAEAIKISAATNGEAQAIQQRLNSGKIDEITAVHQLQEALKANRSSLIDAGRVIDDSASPYTKLADSVAIMGLQFDDEGKVRRKLAETTDAQINKTDSLTSQVIGAEKELEALSRQMKMFAIDLMPQAAGAVRQFTHYVREFINFARDALNGESDRYDFGAVAGEAAKYGTAGAATGAGIGAMGFGVGAGPGALIGGTIGAVVGGGSELAKQYFGKKTTSPGGFGNMGMGGGGGSMPLGGNANLSGLPIKSGESTAGGETSQQLAAVAQAIYSQLGGDVRYFSAFNDATHQGMDSAHNQGNALDFTLNDPKKAAQVAAMLRGMPGVKSVLDEYNYPSSRSTGGHIHVEVPKLAFGGMVSGPKSGYQAMLHGDEAVIPLAGGRSVPVEMPAFTGSLQAQVSLLSDQNSLLSELITLMSSNNSISSKILQVSRG